MDLVIWANGRLIEPDDPVLTATDHGVTVGDGVFETAPIIQGQAFALTRHLRRLRRSAVGLGLEAPDEDAVRAGVEAVLAAGGPALGRLRITVTAGDGPLGSGRYPSSRQSILVKAAPATFADSAKVVRVPWVRNERSAVAGLKTTSYAENARAIAHAAELGADEAIFANTVGELCEGTGSNVFLERDGVMLTPPLSSGCLAGITRELLLEWAQEEGLPVREARPGELRLEDLDQVLAGEAHLALTSSTRNVMPVVSLDGAEVTTGPLTQQARDLFSRRAAADLDP